MTDVGDGHRGSPDLLAILASLSSTCRAAAESIRQTADPQSAFDDASTLADRLWSLAEKAALLRAQQAVRIRETESLSLAELGRRLGVSKQRAWQLVEFAQEAELEDGQ